jgi:hypothetical protein
VNQKYRDIKRRLFPHDGVARRCHRPNYVASSRLALRKNPSVLFVSLFLIHNTAVLTPRRDFGLRLKQELAILIMRQGIPSNHSQEI